GPGTSAGRARASNPRRSEPSAELVRRSRGRCLGAVEVRAGVRRWSAHREMVSGKTETAGIGQLPALRLRARRGPCFSPRMNHALILEALAAAYPDRECIVTPTRRLTYARVADHMRRLA